MPFAGESIFERFCQYVDETIFQDSKGGVVAFIIDQMYIDAFCKKYSKTEKELLADARRHMFSYSRNVSINHIKGIIAIQIYATTKRADDSLISKANYRDRLAELLSWDIDKLREWFEYYQDIYWKRLYDWCDSNYIEISKSYPRDGAWRYVQYPTQQAERVFTREELLYIAYAFVENLLYPDDDISSNVFWIILNWWSLYKYVHTKHAINLYENYPEDAKKQIFNYFLNWNGEYKESFKKTSRIHSDKNEECFVYIKDDLETIEVRDKELKLVGDKIPLISLDVKSFVNRRLNDKLLVRRTDMILFKRDDIYENYWQETRFLEGEEEGLVILFSENKWKHYPSSDLIKVFPHLRIYKVQKNWWTRSLFVDPRFYKLDGGLKIGKHKYLFGGGPIFRISRNANVWVDGELCKIQNNALDLSCLECGVHKIKVQGFKEISFEIIDCFNISVVWPKENSQWQIDKINNSWTSSKILDGIVGMNMQRICKEEFIGADELSPIHSWAITHYGIKSKSNNIIIKTLKNILEDE